MLAANENAPAVMAWIISGRGERGPSGKPGDGDERRPRNEDAPLGRCGGLHDLVIEVVGQRVGEGHEQRAAERKQSGDGAHGRNIRK